MKLQRPIIMALRSADMETAKDLRQEERWPQWREIDEQDVLVTEDEVLVGVSAVLEHFIARSDKLAEVAPTAFDGYSMLPDQSVHAFLHHILRNGLCSKECFIMSLVYCERILQRHPDFVISRRNVHRFVLASVLVGSKIVDDFYCRNVYYAMASGITKANLNNLEMKLCFLLDFEMNVKPEEFALYRNSLIRGRISSPAATFAMQQQASFPEQSLAMHAACPVPSVQVGPVAALALQPAPAKLQQNVVLEFAKPQFVQWPAQALLPVEHGSQVKQRKACQMHPAARMPAIPAMQPPIQVQALVPAVAPIMLVAQAPPQPDEQWQGGPAYSCPWKHNLPPAPKFVEPEPAQASLIFNHPDPLGAAGAWFGYTESAAALQASETAALGRRFPLPLPAPYSCQSHALPTTPIMWLAAQPV